jgi:hypothetical protein
LEFLKAELPSWIAPGDAATLVWYSGRGESAGGMPLYQVAGPALDMPPASPYFLLAPVEHGDFAGRLYRGEVGFQELRGFLQDCLVARGEMSASLDRIAAGVETPVLPVVDAWRGAVTRPLLPYLDDIGAFLPGERPLFVTPETYAAARQEPEQFGTAWVCDECGVWSCRLHPFEFLKEAA